MRGGEGVTLFECMDLFGCIWIYTDLSEFVGFYLRFFAIIAIIAIFAI